MHRFIPFLILDIYLARKAAKNIVVYLKLFIVMYIIFYLFQRVCRNMFSGQLVQSYFGLLSSPPKSVYNELHNMLQQCSQRLDDKSAHILASQLKHLLDLIVQGEV